MITSHTAGRLRLRNDALKVVSLVESIRNRLLKVKGVRDVASNPRTGSLLIHYDATPAVREQLMGVLSFLSEDMGGTGASMPRAPSRNWLPRATSDFLARRKLHYGMLGALGISLAGAVLDSKKLHIVAGFGFLALLVLHLHEKKRFLLPKGGK